MIETNARLATNAMKAIGQRLQEAHARIRELSTENVERRLAHAVQEARMKSEIRTLRTVAERLDAWLSAKDGGLPPKGQWQELASELGVSREALYRELARRSRRSS